jgi:peptide/nickel transport system permease protein
MNVESSSRPSARRQGRNVFTRVLRDKRGLVGVVLVGGMVFMAVFAPWIAPHDPIAQSFDRLAPPSSSHLFGTDDLRRDLLSRIIFGARTSIAVSFFGVGAGALAGTVLGMLAAQRRGVIETLVMRGAEILQSFPGIILAIMIIAILGPGSAQIAVAISVNAIPLFVRLTYGSILKEVQLDYVAATVSLGATPARIARRHLLPNVVPDILPLLSIRLGVGVLSESALSFIGLGAPRPRPTWGRLLSEAGPYLSERPLLAVFPGVAIVILVIGFSLIGDAVQVAVDPRSRPRSLSVAEDTERQMNEEQMNDEVLARDPE